ncbi:hypothetical protein [Streptomyces sp. KE1]|uniref:hypothetical protein n=1 Tax=Streptomyces sp. KE1 TaxID=1638939 RepID=UPI00063E955B|nr:hypothetical protein [Streptomyces sp. KE1]KLJ01799.1 hypothetical protein WQ59_12480 [Streptomyces sp. KE1]
MTHYPMDRPGRDQRVDISTATHLVRKTLSLQLGTTTRTEIQKRTADLEREIGRFARSSATGADTEGQLLRIEAASLMKTAPGEHALAFSAFTYMRNLAGVLRRVIAYGEEVTSPPEDEALPGPSPAPTGSSRSIRSGR